MITPFISDTVYFLISFVSCVQIICLIIDISIKYVPDVM